MQKTTIDDFIKEKEIGKGSFGSVYLVTRKQDHKVYALKTVILDKLNKKEQENSVNEVRLLASVNHPNVIGYKEAFWDDNTKSLNIVMEYADDGDLQTKINRLKKEKKLFNEILIWIYAIQMVEGLKALHDKKIMHRDLKSANIFLVKEKHQCKIGDMNVSKVIKEKVLLTQTGTPYYASPEVWRDEPYSYKSDLWSIGCVIYELCALHPPFNGKDLDDLFVNVCKGKVKRINNIYSDDLWNVIMMLLQVDVNKRADCDEFLKCPIVSKKIQEIKNNPLTYYEGKLLENNLENSNNILMETIRFNTLDDLKEHLPTQKNYIDINEKIINDNKANSNNVNRRVIKIIKSEIKNKRSSTNNKKKVLDTSNINNNIASTNPNTNNVQCALNINNSLLENRIKNNITAISKNDKNNLHIDMQPQQIKNVNIEKNKLAINGILNNKDYVKIMNTLEKNISSERTKSINVKKNHNLLKVQYKNKPYNNFLYYIHKRYKTEEEEQDKANNDSIQKEKTEENKCKLIENKNKNRVNCFLKRKLIPQNPRSRIKVLETNQCHSNRDESNSYLMNYILHQKSLLRDLSKKLDNQITITIDNYNDQKRTIDNDKKYYKIIPYNRYSKRNLAVKENMAQKENINTCNIVLNRNEINNTNNKINKTEVLNKKLLKCLSYRKAPKLNDNILPNNNLYNYKKYIFNDCSSASKQNYPNNISYKKIFYPKSYTKIYKYLSLNNNRSFANRSINHNNHSLSKIKGTKRILSSIRLKNSNLNKLCPKCSNNSAFIENYLKYKKYYRSNKNLMENDERLTTNENKKKSFSRDKKLLNISANININIDNTNRYLNDASFNLRNNKQNNFYLYNNNESTLQRGCNNKMYNNFFFIDNNSNNNFNSGVSVRNLPINLINTIE